jgi:hypothetical protein
VFPVHWLTNLYSFLLACWFSYLLDITFAGNTIHDFINRIDFINQVSKLFLCLSPFQDINIVSKQVYVGKQVTGPKHKKDSPKGTKKWMQCIINFAICIFDCVFLSSPWKYSQNHQTTEPPIHRLPASSVLRMQPYCHWLVVDFPHSLGNSLFLSKCCLHSIG